MKILRVSSGRAALFSIAIAAFVFVVIRADRQSVTWDEASTFLRFVWSSPPAQWTVDSNNHVLNSILEAISVQLFGASGLTIRIPALLGAALYIGVAVCFCVRYMRNVIFATIALACLVLNPFVLDFLVAARGYSLGMAFLVFAFLLLTIAREDPRKRISCSVAASTAIGLSVSAQFSFGIVGMVSLLVFAGLFVTSDRKKFGPLLAALLIPAPLVALTICGPALTQFKTSELVIGTGSLLDMLGSVIRNSFDGPNPNLVNPDLFRILAACRYVIPVLILVLAIAVVVLIIRRGVVLNTAAAPLVLIAIASIVVQTVFSLATHSLLPVDRTILYLAPIMTLSICLGVVAVEQKLITNGAIIVMALAAAFFSLSARMHFSTWPFNANAAQVYDALRLVAASNPKRSIGVNPIYFQALNFYQAIDRNPTFPPIDNRPSGQVTPVGRDIYVVTAGLDDDFVAHHGLKVVYSFPEAEFPNTEIAVGADIRIPILATPP